MCLVLDVRRPRDRIFVIPFGPIHSGQLALLAQRVPVLLETPLLLHKYPIHRGKGHLARRQHPAR